MINDNNNIKSGERSLKNMDETVNIKIMQVTEANQMD